MQSESATESAPHLDAVFDALSDGRRRTTVSLLQTHERPMALADVADEIAIREHDADITSIPAEEVKRIYTSLYHSHVPKMAAAGLVVYSQERDVVALSDDAEQVGPILEFIEE